MSSSVTGTPERLHSRYSDRWKMTIGSSADKASTAKNDATSSAARRPYCI